MDGDPLRLCRLLDAPRRRLLHRKGAVGQARRRRQGLVEGDDQRGPVHRRRTERRRRGVRRRHRDRYRAGFVTLSPIRGVISEHRITVAARDRPISVEVCGWRIA